MQKNFTLPTTKKSTFLLYFSILSAFVLSIGLTSCKKTGDSGASHPSVTEVEFAGAPGVGSYYLKSNNAQFKIPIALTTVSSVDRTINVSITSKTAVLGTQYSTPPTSITIKAGQVIDTIRFSGLFSGYPTGRKDTISVKVSGYPAMDGVDTYKFVTQAYCDVVQASLLGNYTTTTDYYPAVGSGASAAKYTATISNWTPINSTSATVSISNLGKSPDTGFGPFQGSDPAATGITAKLDWTNPANFTITIASQPYMASLYTYGAATISGSGTWSACDQKFTLGYSIKVAAGTFSNQWTVLTR